MCLSFHGRENEYALGEVRTLPLFNLKDPFTGDFDSSITGFSYSFALKFPQVMSVVSGPGDIYITGSTIALEFGKNVRNRQMLLNMEIFNRPSFRLFNGAVSGPNLQYWNYGATDWHYFGFSVDFVTGEITYTFDDIEVVTDIPVVDEDAEDSPNLYNAESIAEFISSENAAADSIPVYLRIGKRKTDRVPPLSDGARNARVARTVAIYNSILVPSRREKTRERERERGRKPCPAVCDRRRRTHRPSPSPPRPPLLL